MLLFRFLVANVFLAIIDKYFVQLDQEMRQVGEAKKSSTGPSASPRENTSIKPILNSEPGSISRSHTSSQDIHAAAMSHELPPSENDIHRQANHIEHNFEDEIPHNVREDRIPTESKWHLLPGFMKTWSLNQAREIDRFIREQKQKRTEVLANNDLQGAQALEDVLQRSESEIKNQCFKRRNDAANFKVELERNELRELKKVHETQEEMSWYIQRKESELLKLESRKRQKEERFIKMHSAATSLIRDEDGEDELG